MSTTTWNVDPAHSVAEFKVKHMMISNVKGHFPKVSGVLTLDGDDLGKSSVEASIDVSSIVTRDEQRDGHLKSADFFDVEKYPTITFKSTKVRAGGRDCGGRSDHQGRDQDGGFPGGRPDRAGEGPLGQ